MTIIHKLAVLFIALLEISKRGHSASQQSNDSVVILKEKDSGPYLTTIVTSLMDIKRETVGDGRKFSDYISWLLKTCILAHPMVIFLDNTKEGLLDKVSHIRAKVLKRFNIPTILVTEPPTAMPYSYAYPQVEAILTTPEWKTKTKHPNDVTNLNPNYIIVQYSKFEWMTKAMALIRGHWHTDGVAWMDAGFSRFFPAAATPGTYQLKAHILEDVRKRNIFACSGSDKFDGLLAGRLKLNPDTFIGTNENIVKGGILITTPTRLPDFASFMKRFVDDELIAKKRIDNEQIALALLAQEHRDWFRHIGNPGFDYDGEFMFQVIPRNRTANDSSIYSSPYVEIAKDPEEWRILNRTSTMAL